MAGLPWPAWLPERRVARRHRHVERVAFADCDAMGVLWHGNYLAYAERARHALAAELGYGVADLRARRRFAPVVGTAVQHLLPARPGDGLVITVSLYACDQPRLYHRYDFEVGGRLIARAATDQVLTDEDFNLVLHCPAELAALFASADGAPP